MNAFVSRVKPSHFIGIAMITGLLCAFGVQALDNLFNPHPQFATVNLIAVLQEQVDREVRDKSPTDITENTQAIGQQVQQAVEQLSQDYRVTLIASQAVIVGNLPDLTEELRRRLQEQRP